MKQRIDETILSEISMVNTPQFSENGHFISYFEEQADLETNTYRKRVFCYERGTGNTQLVPAERVKFVCWSRENHLYLFCAGSEHTTQVVVWNPQKQCITEQFSLPDLTKAVLLSDTQVLLSALYQQKADDAGYLSITDSPFWGDGRSFTNGIRMRLGIYDRTANQTTWITSPTFQVANWFVDHDTVYYTGTDFVRCLHEKGGLYAYRISTGETCTLIPEGEYYMTSIFLLDGVLFFFGSDGKRYGRYEYGGFYTVDLHGGGAQLKIPYDANVAASSIYCDAINPNGTKQKVHDHAFYFVTTQDEKSSIKAMTADGRITDVVVSPKLVTAFDIHGDDMVYVGCVGMQLAELYLKSLSTQAEPAQLTAYSQPILQTYEVSAPKPVTATDREGNQVHGWVMEPIGQVSGKKAPLILYVHGGPRIAFNDCFVAELQCLAAKGYGICYCNPIGSDSRGNEYGNLCARYGDIDYAQILSFLQEVIQEYPCFDPDRVGIMGGSYGGYMVNWTIGHTDRFRAAVSERSIANWITLETLSDIGAFYVADQTGKSLLRDEIQDLWDNSPLKYAGNVKTPTLFIQSECDFRCPREETFQMFYMLNKRNIDTKVLYFKGESHNLCRRGAPRNRRARISEISQWFQSHLD